MIERPIIGQIFEPTAGDPSLRFARLVTAVHNRFIWLIERLDASAIKICYRYLDQSDNEPDHEVPWREWESWMDTMKPDVSQHPLVFVWDINGHVGLQDKWEEGGPDGYHIIVTAETLAAAEAKVRAEYQRVYGTPPPFQFSAPSVRLAPAVIMISYSNDGG